MNRRGLLIETCACACALLLHAGSAAAGGVVPRLDLVPHAPAPRDVVQLREDVPAGSVSFSPHVLVSSGRIEITFHTPDFTGPFPAQTLFHPVGQLAPGTYRVDYIGCGNPPPPQPACSFVGSETFVVTGGSTAVSVPASGRESVVLLVVGILGVLVLRARRAAISTGSSLQ